MGNHTQSTLHLLSKRSSERMLDKYHRDELVTCHQYWSTIKTNLKNVSSHDSHENPVKISIFLAPYLIFACHRLPSLPSYLSRPGRTQTARLTKGIFNEASTSDTRHPFDLASWRNNGDPQQISMRPYMCISKEMDIHSYIHTFNTFIHSSMNGAFMPENAFVLSYLHTMNEK